MILPTCELYFEEAVLILTWYIYIPDVRDKNHKGTNSVTVNLEFISEELGDYNKGEEVIDNEDDVQAAW